MHLMKRLLPAILLAAALAPAAARNTADGALQDAPTSAPSELRSQDHRPFRYYTLSPDTVIHHRSGAIAASEDGRHIQHAADAATENEALASAVGDCERRTGRRCIKLITYTNGCAAVAADFLPEGGYRLWAAEGQSRRSAERVSLDKCRNEGGTNCRRISLPKCSYPQSSD